MLPSVIKAKYVNDYLIEVKFNDGTKKIIDFEGWLYLKAAGIQYSRCCGEWASLSSRRICLITK